MNLNGVEYYYIRNAQGDIIGLIDKDGTQVVSYSYDSWGKLISIDGSLKDTVGVKNPYRYRGYRYDTETGLYYLQSRYYNPEWGRFINADAVAGQVGDLLSHNIFAYSKNDPINYCDPDGFARIRIMDDAGHYAYSWGGPSYSCSSSSSSSGTSRKPKANKKPAKKGYDVGGAVAGIASSTAYSTAGETTIGTIVEKSGYYKGMPIPVKLSTFESFGRFNTACSLVLMEKSVTEDLSGQYCTSQAILRTMIDVGSTVAIIAFCGSGGWLAVGLAFAISAGAEGLKYGVDKSYNNFGK